MTATLKPGFHTITPYVLVRGATEMIEFLRDAFGGEETFRAANASGRLMHAEVRVGNAMVELADGSDEFPPIASAFHVYVDDADATYARAVAAGATTLHAPVDQAYGDREAGVVDRFGNHWYIATHREDVSEEEMMRRFAEPVPLRQMPGVGPVPRGFWTVNATARVNGAARLIEFLLAAFDADVQSRTDGPGGTVRNAQVRIGDSILEVSDAHGEWTPMHSAAHLWVDDVDATHTRAVAAGATTLRPPADAPYGERNATIVDPLGNQWYIAKPL